MYVCLFSLEISAKTFCVCVCVVPVCRCVCVRVMYFSSFYSINLLIQISYSIRFSCKILNKGVEGSGLYTEFYRVTLKPSDTSSFSRHYRWFAALESRLPPPPPRRRCAAPPSSLSLASNLPPKLAGRNLTEINAKLY